MKKFILLPFILLLFSSTLILTSCSDNDPDPIVGTWQTSEGASLAFSEDKNFIATSPKGDVITGMYVKDGAKLSLIANPNSDPQTESYDIISITSTTLTMSLIFPEGVTLELNGEQVTTLTVIFTRI